MTADKLFFMQLHWLYTTDILIYLGVHERIFVRFTGCENANYVFKRANKAKHISKPSMWTLAVSIDCLELILLASMCGNLN